MNRSFMQYPITHQNEYDCAFCDFSTRGLLTFEKHSLELHFPKPLPVLPSLPSASSSLPSASSTQPVGSTEQDEERRQHGKGKGRRNEGGRTCQSNKWWRELREEWNEEMMSEITGKEKKRTRACSAQRLRLPRIRRRTDEEVTAGVEVEAIVAATGTVQTERSVGQIALREPANTAPANTAKAKAAARSRGGKKGGKGGEVEEAVSAELVRRGFQRGSPAWVAAQGSERLRELLVAGRSG